MQSTTSEDALFKGFLGRSLHIKILLLGAFFLLSTGSAFAANPTLSSPTATNITQTTATLGATVTSYGTGNGAVERGICYNTTGSPRFGTATCVVEGNITTGAYTVPVSGLTAGTTYYYAGYADGYNASLDVDYYGYSADGTFTTLANTPPAEPTFSATCTGSPGAYSVNLSWNAVSGATNYPVRMYGPSHATGDSGGYAIGLATTNTTNDTDVIGWGAVGDAPTGTSISLTGLTASGVYTYWGHAWNSTTGWSTNTSRTVTCSSAPSIGSVTATNIGVAAATQGATVSSDNSATVTTRGMCQSTAPSPRVDCAASGSGTGSYTVTRTNMTNQSTWYIAGYATNAKGTTWTSDLFVTLQSKPTVTSPTSSSVTQTTATLGATFATNASSLSISARGTCWGTSPSPTGNCLAQGGVTTGAYTQARTGFSCGTTYYYRGYVSYTDGAGIAGTEYSTDGTFTTSACASPPTITSATLSSIANNGATFGGNITSNGGAAITDRGTCWGTTASPRTNCLSEGGTATGAFTHARTGMSANTTYYYAAYATNSAGTSYVNAGPFTTDTILSFSPTSTTYPGSINFTSSGGNGTGGVTYAVTSSGTAVCSVTGSALSYSNAGTCTVSATKAADATYVAQSTSNTITINKQTQSALVLTSIGTTYPNTLSLTTSGGSGTGAVTYSVTSAGTAGCSITGTTLSYSNAGSCTVTATKAADINYNSATTGPTTVTVSQASQSALSITTTSTTYPGPLTLSTSGGSGTGAVSYVVNSAGTAGCSVSGASLSFTAAGTCTVTATKAGDTNYMSVSSSGTTITINTGTQAALNITSTSGTYPTAVSLTTSGGSGSGAVSYVVNSAGTAGCSVSGSTLSYSNAGTCTVTATKAADAGYAAISSSATTITINQASQSALSITSTSVTYPSSLTLTTSGGSGTGAVSYSVTSAGTAGCSVSGTTLSYSNAGTCTVTATKAGDTNYTSVSSSATTITINKATQSAISITSTSVTYPSTLSLSTTGGTGTGAVSYSVTSAGTAGCSVSGSTLSYSNAGTCTVTATKAADANYNSISSSATTITINQASQSALSITSTTGYYPGPLSLTTSGGSGTGSVSYVVNSTGTAGCSVSGSTLSFTSTGTCTVTATKAGDTNYISISSGVTTITLNVTPPTIGSPTVTSIGTSTATLSATITSSGGGALSSRGTCISGISGQAYIGGAGSLCTAEGGTATGAFSYILTNRTAGTTYYYEGWATNAGGTSYTSEVPFTMQSVPTITSPTGNSVGINQATLGATLTASGVTVNARGVCIGTSPAPTSCTSSGTATGAYTQSFTSLTAGTLYYYRGYVTYTDGAGNSATLYTSDNNFTTQTPPSISSPTAASVGITRATIGFTFGSNVSSLTINSAGSCYATTPSPTNCLVSGGTAPAIYSQMLSGLSSGTLYYSRGYVTYTDGAGISNTIYTSDASFTTQTAPTISTPTVASVGINQMTVGANFTGNPSGMALTARGTCWGTSPAPTSCTSSGSTLTGVYTQTASSLTPATLYYSRGYVSYTDGAGITGTVYTSDTSATTQSIPTINTPTSTAVGSSTATLGANFASNASALPVTGRGICWATTASPTSNCTSSGTATGVYTQSVSGFAMGTFYYYRGYVTYTDGAGITSTIYTTDGTFTTLNVPSIGTPVSGTIGTSTVVLGATVTSNGGSALTARGTCWGTSPSPRGNCLAEGGTTVAAFTHTRSGLTASTTYYFAGYATNLYGTVYTSDGTFTTMAPPYLISPTSTAVSTSSAILGANLASDGGATISARGICWGTSPSPTGNCTSSGTATGVYTITITGLPSSTVIYYRGFATNVWGTSYSPDGTFTTLGMPTITGQSASGLSSTQVTLSANITSNNGAAITARGTCYDTIPTPQSNCLPEGGTSIGTFTHTRASLTPGTAYYYRAFATNAYGTSYSPDGTFVTPFLADPSSVSVQAGNASVTATYITPPDSWIKGIVTLMSTSTAVTATPVNGTSYAQGATVGGATVACVDLSGPSVSDSCTINGLTNGTTYHFKVYSVDNLNKYSSGVVPTGSPATPTFSTILTSGTDPSSATIAPGGPATFVDAFTLKTATSSEVISSIIINLANASSTSLVEITNDTGSVVYGSSTNPTNASTTITLSMNTLTATTALTQYKIRITPKSHANLPIGASGQLYPVSATVYSWTGTYTRSGGDYGSATITIDNAPPADLSSPSIVAGDSKFTLSYTAPSDSDLGPMVVLVSASPISAVPTEGATYFTGNVIGSALVGCVDNLSIPAALSSCTVSGLSNGSLYYVKVFTSDTRGNYSAGSSYTVTPAIPAATEKVTSFRYRNDDGTESGATYRLPEGSSITSGFVKGDKVRLRFAISNESASTTVRSYQLEYSTGACSVWNAVPRASDITSQPWKMDVSSYVADGTPTTHTSSIGTPPGKTFTSGVVQTFSSLTPPITLLTGKFTEVEYLIRSTTYSSDSTVYCFRVSNSGEVGNFISQALPTLIPISNVFRFQGGGGGGAKSNIQIETSATSGPVRTGGTASSTDTSGGNGTTTSTTTPIKGSAGDSDVGVLMFGNQFAFNFGNGMVLGETTSQMCTNFKSAMSQGSTDLSSAPKVSELQYLLKRLGYFNFKVTGYYGDITKAAVEQFQKDNNITPTGTVGPITRQKMKEMGCVGE